MSRTEPERIVDSQDHEARDLVRAARADKPSPALEGRITGALAGAPMTPRPARGPWLAGASFVVVAGLVAVGWGLRDRASIAPAPQVVTAPIDTAPPSPPPPTPREEPASISADSLPDVPAERAKPRNGAATSASAGAPSIDREIKLLDATKRQLEKGATGEAASELATYEHEFPNGALRREAEVLRIRLELSRGNGARARKLADEFVARDPNSVHAKRVRALFEAP